MYYQPPRRRRPLTGPVLTAVGVLLAAVSRAMNTIGHQRYDRCMLTTLDLGGTCDPDRSMIALSAAGTVVGVALVLAGIIVWAVQWNRG